MLNIVQAIQTALFYNKNKFYMFKSDLFYMFLDLPGSCGPNKTNAYKKTDYWNDVSDICKSS